MWQDLGQYGTKSHYVFSVTAVTGDALRESNTGLLSLELGKLPYESS